MSLIFPSWLIPDLCVWLDHCNVVFSVKKAYSKNYLPLLQLSNFNFMKWWKIDMSPRLHLLGWRILFNILPSADVLLAISMVVPIECVLPNKEKETLIHIFIDYDFVRLT